MPDIDIDFADRSKILARIKNIAAVRKEGQKILKHNTGIYMHTVNYDPSTAMCNISYDESPSGYFKIDFLNFSLYEGILSEDHLIELMNREPIWDLLEQSDFVDLLYHVSSHASILKVMKPKNIEQLAAILAMIRPAKRYLIGQPWEKVMDEIWIKPIDGEYYFKKSHATAYAVAVAVHMNLICEKISMEYS